MIPCSIDKGATIPTTHSCLNMIKETVHTVIVSWMRMLNARTGHRMLSLVLK